MEFLLDKGARVEIIGVMDDPNPLPIGSQGTVVKVLNRGNQWEQIIVDWENGRGLMLVPEDPFVVIS